jgi:hypothetical protein
MKLQLTLFLLIWFSPVAQLPSADCVQSIEKPSYPGGARRFDSEATVTAHFIVMDDGAVQNAIYDSKERLTPGRNDLLRAEVQFAVERTQFKRECKGDYTLYYRFVIVEPRTSEPNTRVEFNAPNEFVVTANQDIVRCSVYSINKPTWIKRLSHWLRRRGPPQTITEIECY